MQAIHKHRQTRTFFLLVLVLLALNLTACGQEEDTTAASQEEGPALARTTSSPVSTEAPATAVPSRAPTLESTEEVTAEPAATTEEAGETTAEAIQPADPTATSTPEVAAVELPPKAGALIAVSMDGRVGVLLDELPGVLREAAAEAILDQPEAYWRELAFRQTRLTLRRLNFRNFFYAGKGQMPPPPPELWEFEIDPAGPELETVNGHELVLVDYTFSSTLLTDEDSPEAAEPALAEVGGQWDEPFVLPLDPNLLLQRTANACLNEAGFPPNSFDSENAWIFYDHTCEANDGGQLGCHRSQLPRFSCLEALSLTSGTLETAMRFERLEWDDELADAVRVGEISQAEGPDLKVYGDDLSDYRIIYRYFPSDSCALVEGCINGSGWRRLLQFTATVHNVGVAAMHIGPVVTENPIYNLFQYNTCHDHFHFSDYGDFFFAGLDQEFSSKQAFCVESTNRFSNNEWSPLTHGYACRIQGVQAGWVDEYVAGLDCQWIDITDFDIPAGGEEFELGFTSNPDQFLCEGELLRDEDGNQIWEPSGLTTPTGADIMRPVCDFVPDWDANNSDTRPVFLSAAGSFVTEPCSGSELGPKRNCDFVDQTPEVPAEAAASTRTPRVPASVLGACTPGQTVQLSCQLEDGEDDLRSQVLRICDYSHLLGVGVACTFLDALANVIVGPEPVTVEFACPFVRDEDEPGGRYALYTAPVLSEEEEHAVSCTVEQ